MNFSSTTFEEREKETKALKGFLALSLIGSLGLHVAVLASGVGNYFARTSPAKEEPIEIAIVDPPQEEKVEVLKPEKYPQKVEIQETTVQPPSKVELSSLPQQIIQPKQPISPKQPAQKLVENLKNPLQPDKSVASSNINSSNSTSNVRHTLRQLKNSQSRQSAVTNNITSSAPGNGTPGGGGGGTSVFTGNGTGSISGSGTGNGTGIGSGNGSGIGSGNGTGIGSGNGSGIGNTGNNSGSGGQVATATTTPKLPSNPGDGAGNSRRGGDGRAECRDCSAKYSERARRRKVEGRPIVAVDADANGKVTNARLIGSSGDRELDEEHLRQARNWKLKPSESGRQGVQISTEYAIEGSRRYQQVRKRQQERQERQRQRETANNNEVSRSSRRLRRTNTTEATSTRVRRSEGENSAANRPQRRRREITSDVRTSGETPQRRRRRRDLTPSSQPSAGTSRLLNSLRRSSQSAPAAAPSSSVTP